MPSRPVEVFPVPIAVACPSCGAKLKVPEALAGRRVKCLKCGSSFTASEGRAAVPSPEAPDDSLPARRPAKIKRNRKKKRQSRSYTGSLAWTLVGLVGGGVYGYNRELSASPPVASPPAQVSPAWQPDYAADRASAYAAGRRAGGAFGGAMAGALGLYLCSAFASGGKDR